MPINPYASCTADLNYLYGQAKIELLSNDDSMIKKKYSIYYSQLIEEIEDQILCYRIVKKGLVQGGLSTGSKVYFFIRDTVGVMVPGAALVGEVGRQIPNMIEAGRHWKNTGEFMHAGSHVLSSCNSQVSNHMRRDQIKEFMKRLSEELTFRFRSEIPVISDNDCRELAARHFNSVFACLTNLVEHPSDEEMTQEQLLNALVQNIDPNPKEEIKKEIGTYINQRTARWFRSNVQSRESFLNEFLTNLDSQNVDLSQSIQTICDSVFFRNDWKESVGTSLSQEFPELSLANPLLNNLKLINTSLVQPDQTQRTFNTPFLTAYFRKHISLKDTSKNVALYLMRWIVMSTSNETTTRIEEIAKITLQELSMEPVDKQILQLSTQLEDLQNQVNELMARGSE